MEESKRERISAPYYEGWSFLVLLGSCNMSFGSNLQPVKHQPTLLKIFWLQIKIQTKQEHAYDISQMKLYSYQLQITFKESTMNHVTLH